MSTRSGKRIHNSLLEDTTSAGQEPAVKSERKTRSKRVQENIDELCVSLFKNKKRNNYVRYPTDDELLGNTTTKNGEEHTKPSRTLRKNALREQNPSENIENFETKAKNLIRKSRRGKKVDDEEETENHENIPVIVPETTKSKKNKKKKRLDPIVHDASPAEEAPAKKSKKKKKKGKKISSMIVEDIPQNDNSKNNTLNKINMSVDSFHSAAGSPISKDDNIDQRHVNHNGVEENYNLQKSSTKPLKKICNNNNFDTNNEHINMTVDLNEESNNTVDKGSKKKRKSVSNNATFGECFVAVTRDNLEKDLENIINVSNLSNGQLNKRKSSLGNAIFNKQEETFSLNVSSMSNKRKSSLKEAKDVIDKSLQRSSVKDVIFHKSNASITKEIDNNDIELDFNVSNVSNNRLSSRQSVLKDNTFDKSNSSITNGNFNESNTYNKEPKVQKSIAKDTTFDKSVASITNTEDGSNVLNHSNKKLRRSTFSVKDSTFDKAEEAVNTTFEKDTEIIEKANIKDSTFNKSNKNLNATYEKDLLSNSAVTTSAKGTEQKTIVNTTYDKCDTTFEKDSSTSFDAFKKGAMTRKSSIRDNTFDKSNTSIVSLTKEDFEKDNNIITSSAAKRRSIRRSTFDKTDVISSNGNTSYDKLLNTESELKRKSPRKSDIQIKLNTTFEKENIVDEKEKDSSKSSLISSDNSSISDKSDTSRISITSDDTTEHIENIINTTPVLIESSMDDSRNSMTKKESPKPQTPLKREGTFTKDGPEITEKDLETPTKRKSSMPAAGCTPYHVSKSSQKKTMLNVTRSIEKGTHVSVDPAPRLTRVMFCSPVANPVMATQEKRKIIKSNLKGSNKSFVFEETVSASRPGRKRSYTQSDAEDSRVKRTRLTEDLQQSVDRLSRPRTASATAKLTVTPNKRTTPSKPKSDLKPARTKLPNFAAMHQKQFSKMESLNECQERKAKRAKQLLTPTAPPGLLDRISPKNNPDSPKGKEQAKPKEKTDTPTKKVPTLESLRPGFTRFGFKLNMDVNPFSIPSKTEKPKEKPVEIPSDIPPRQGVLPSLVGATSVRRETAKLAVMREKSFTGKRSVNRNETRTIIKGVRTNRRFELQMKLRNIE